MNDQQETYRLRDSIAAQPVLVLGGDEARWNAAVVVLQQELSVAPGDTIIVTTVPLMAELLTILARIALKPVYGNRSLVCFYQVDRWPAELLTVLLKTIEEPPTSTLLGLFTTSGSELPATIRSRVVTIRFSTQPQAVCQDAEFLSQTNALPDQFRAAVKLVEAEIGIDSAFEQWLTKATDRRVLRQLIALRTTIGSTPINRRLALEAGLLVTHTGDTSV